MHKTSAQSKGGFTAMMQKDKTAQKAAVDEYFKHWDNKAAKDETAADRKVCYSFPLHNLHIVSSTNESALTLSDL